MSSKKFFDIIPPKIEKRRLTQIGQPSIQAEPPKEKSTFKKGLILVITVLLIFAGLVFFFLSSNAEIEIWPEVEVLKLQKEIEVDETMTESDSTFWLKESVIPGKFFEEVKEGTQQFSSSGTIKKEVLAKGQIRIYSKYHEPVTLIVGTHFMADSGKQFHSLKRITIPAKGYLDGVEVEADIPGEDYNIGPSKFSVPGLRKYSPPELFYSILGESSVAMEGGLIETVSQVTQEDLDRAEEILVEKLLKEGEESLKKAIPPDFILLKEVLEQRVVEKFSLAKVDQELESFISRVKINSRAFVFKKSDLEDFTEELILTQMGAGKKFHEESLELKYESRLADLKIGKITLSLQISAKIYSDVSFQMLKQKIRGQFLTEGKSLLLKQPEIFKAQVKLWPFWVKKIPENTEKIKIKLNID